MNPKGIDGNEPTEGSNLLNSGEKMQQEATPEPNHLQRIRQTFACPPHGLLDSIVTNGMYTGRMNSDQEDKRGSCYDKRF